MPYMMPVSPWFFTNLPGYKKNWIWRGDHKGPAASGHAKGDRLAISSFSYTPAGWWRTKVKPAVETGVVDGLFSWAGWPWGDEDMNTYIDASYIQYPSLIKGQSSARPGPSNVETKAFPL
jgi:hypothetical protein